MQTITVAQINQTKVDTAKFLRTIGDTKIKREVKTKSGQKAQLELKPENISSPRQRAPAKHFEKLEAVANERLNTKNERIKGVAIGVIRRKRPGVVVSLSLVNGYLQRVETEQEVEDFTRYWLGHESYALFCFMSGHPGGTYHMHRLLVAQALTKDTIEDDQQLVLPVGYNLPAVRKSFGKNIWDQNFKRTDAISKGRIRGVAMQSDPLYSEFANIETFIGVEVPITGSNQMVKVFSDGRLQFMGLQPGVIEDPATRENALDTIVQVVDKLSAAETK